MGHEDRNREHAINTSSMTLTLHDGLPVEQKITFQAARYALERVRELGFFASTMVGDKSERAMDAIEALTVIDRVLVRAGNLKGWRLALLRWLLK